MYMNKSLAECIISVGRRREHIERMQATEVWGLWGTGVVPTCDATLLKQLAMLILRGHRVASMYATMTADGFFSLRDADGRLLGRGDSAIEAYLVAVEAA